MRLHIKLVQTYIKNHTSLNLLKIVLKMSLYPNKYLVGNLVGDSILDVGCGEGMLSNILAQEFKGQIVGVDLDSEKIRIAESSRLENRATFIAQDLFEDTTNQHFNNIIVNDFLHHHSYEDHKRIVDFLAQRLSSEGRIIVKEVGNLKSLDYFLTKRIDSRIYPNDTLSFRSESSWVDLFESNGFRLLKRRVSRHIWPSCRTILVFEKVN